MIRRLSALLMALLCLAGAALADNVASEFHDGRAAFEQGGAWGYIDTEGNIVIQPKYYQATSFCGGYGYVGTLKKNSVVYSYVDVNGKTVATAPSGNSKTHYSLATDSWFGDYGFVEKYDYNSKKKMFEPTGYLYLNAKSKPLSKTVFTHVTPFDSEGYAVVGTGKLTQKGTRVVAGGAHMIAYLNGNNFTDASTSFYFMDRKGKQLGKTTYTKAPRQFSEGLAAVPAKTNARGDSTWGYIDPKGKEAIPAQFSAAEDFKDGIARVAVGGRWGYIGKSGEWVIEAEWDSLGEFREGLAAAKRDGLTGFVDRSGKTVVRPEWQSASPFSGGLACVRETGDYGKYGYIDQNGNIVIPPQYSSAYSFTDGYACACDGFAWGVIDTKGATVVPFAYKSIRNLGHGVFAAVEYASPMIVDAEGNAVTVVLKNGAIPETPIPDGTRVRFTVFPEMENGMQLGTFLDESGSIVSMNLTASRITGEDYTIRTGTGKTVVYTAENGRAEGEWDEVSASEAKGSVILRVKQGSKYGYLSENGGKLTRIEYDKAGLFSDDVAIVWKGGKWYIIGTKGETIF